MSLSRDSGSVRVMTHGRPAVGEEGDAAQLAAEIHDLLLKEVDLSVLHRTAVRFRDAAHIRLVATAFCRTSAVGLMRRRRWWTRGCQTDCG